MPKMSNTIRALPTVLLDELSTLGTNIALARKRRRISRREMAERMMVNPKTVERMEKGDPKIGIGIVATALWVLGMQRRLSDLVSPESDNTGLKEDIRRLPQVIRSIKAQADDFDF
jgi:transcriptional regulator with XRE-family HTH domain